MEKLRNINYIKLLKIAAGAAISTAIAYGLHLEYAPSAGIICLLTIQDTRRETINVTIKRLLAFGAVTLICCGFFGTLGFTLPVLGAVLAVFLLLCSIFSVNEASAMCSVIATHYFGSTDISAAMIVNEAFIFLAGAGIGIILNLFVPTNIRMVRHIQHNTDERIRQILARMAIYITKEDKTDYTDSCFKETDRLLASMKTEAAVYLGNSYGTGKDYFLRYCDMRMRQCQVLTRIYTDIMRVRLITSHAEPIADFLTRMSIEFHEMNNAAGLLDTLEGLFEHYKAESLPASRDEFESRAMMYHILCDLHYFVSLKADFAASLTDKEKQLYYSK